MGPDPAENYGSEVTHSVAVSAAAGMASARGGSKVGTAAADLAGVEVGETLLNPSTYPFLTRVKSKAIARYLGVKQCSV